MKMQSFVLAAVALSAIFLCEIAFGDNLGPLPEIAKAHEAPMADVPFKIAQYKSNWKKRIEAIKKKGQLPIIDIESSFNPSKLDAKEFAMLMDEQGVALIAFSAEIGQKGFEKEGKVWSDGARRIVHVDPWRYIPVTTAGIHPAWTEQPDKFLEETLDHAAAEGYPMLGEFEFRHYPSPRQYKRGEMYRDVTIPINGPLGHKLFSFAEKTGIPFEIHYEIEDKLLPPLEEMLAKYPKAKVVWCHLAQVRYQERGAKYGPEYIRRLIETYPNLYFDLAFGSASSEYPGSGERHARVWADQRGTIKKEWVDLIAKYPWRFVAALDLGGDRMDRLPENVQTLRNFIDQLPEQAQEVVAYKSAWKLLFQEEL